MSKLTKLEILARTENLFKLMNSHYQDWAGIVIVSKTNQYYFTGTMQDGLLLISRDGSVRYFVRKSYTRALEEGLIDNIYEIKSYKDILSVIGDESYGTLYIESEVMPVAMNERLQKHLKYAQTKSVDSILKTLRSIKSDYEIELLKQSGECHHKFLTEVAPGLLKEGITEAQYLGELYHEAIKRGYQGFARFSMFQTEMVMGQLSFGENSLYPTNFDGPGGQRGDSAVNPVLPSKERALKKGDLVFVDISYGLEGYHTDKTQVYMFGAKPDEYIVKLHERCIHIQQYAAKNLKEGSIPSEVYIDVMSKLDSDFKKNFMGTGTEQVRFLGHGTGLNVDEFPVISAGFKMPIKRNMVIALEPKYHIENIGVVGVEDTFVVTQKGCEAITGGGEGIICVN